MFVCGGMYSIASQRSSPLLVSHIDGSGFGLSGVKQVALFQLRVLKRVETCTASKPLWYMFVG